eukprot:365334-Chlamydomonas_euryale.AAC.3
MCRSGPAGGVGVVAESWCGSAPGGRGMRGPATGVNHRCDIITPTSGQAPGVTSLAACPTFKGVKPMQALRRRTKT